MTLHMQSRELKMHDIIDLMAIFNILVNEWPLKAHQINDQISRRPPAPLIGWQLTGLQADTMLQTAAVALQQGHIDLWVSVWGGPVCLLCTYSAKCMRKGGKHTALFPSEGLQKSLNHCHLLKKRSCDVLLTAPSAFLLWLLCKQEDNNFII